jgi:solute carrier family 25 carnitine/acylcarnitine transporter 20/29
MQALPGHGSMVNEFQSIFKHEGLRGLYRGSYSLLIGGGIMRSAQFGVYSSTIAFMSRHTGGPTRPADRLLGIFDPQVIVGGFFGGIGRGVVEAPFENIKVRRQVDAKWSLRELYIGSGTTILRNSILVTLFMVNIDLSKYLFPDTFGPFLTGAITANLAWLTIWPLDVIKSQIQSGKHEGQSMTELLRKILKSGALYRGLIPGLTRSTVANGLSMAVYDKVEKYLKGLQ